MNIGIDIGGSHIAIGIINNSGEILKKEELTFSEEMKKDIINTIEEYVNIKINEYKEIYEIKKIGISIPGITKEGVIEKTINLKLDKYDIASVLEKKYKLPVIVRNDAKNACLAEYKYGVLQNSKRSIFLTLGTGIGGACIIDGKLLGGNDDSTSEFGHMVIQKDGIECKCGRKGCFEKYASMKKFKEDIRVVLDEQRYISSKEILEILKTNKEKICNEVKSEKEIKLDEIVEDYIRNLAIGIVNLINIFEPDVIGIGGSFSYFYEILLTKLTEEVNSNGKVFNQSMIGKLKIKTAILGNDAGIIGAVIEN